MDDVDFKDEDESRMSGNPKRTAQKVSERAENINSSNLQNKKKYREFNRE